MEEGDQTINFRPEISSGKFTVASSTSSVRNCSFEGEKQRIHTRKPGIVYLSSIPYNMTVKKLRDMLSPYGQIGHIFLQPEKRLNSQTGKKQKRFSEGWVEFKDKRVAKKVALSLNNTMVGGKKRSKSYEAMWNLKYLHKFHWLHLTEQLTYENAIRKQKMRAVEAQAKREANFFQQQIEKGENLRKLEETVLKKGGLWNKYQLQIKQNQSIKEGRSNESEKNKALFPHIFGPRSYSSSYSPYYIPSRYSHTYRPPSESAAPRRFSKPTAWGRLEYPYGYFGGQLRGLETASSFLYRNYDLDDDRRMLRLYNPVHRDHP